MRLRKGRILIEGSWVKVSVIWYILGFGRFVWIVFIEELVDL